jgi:POT family proton-dependent oligopeptide transporter
MSEINKQSNHPKGLYYLFFTEMWERFGYYLMLGIFSLFMLDSVENGGMGFSALKKSDIYGTYIGLVYLSPFIGGLLADRLLGYRKSILIGGLLMSAGYICLGLPDGRAFYLALFLIILGNGFFKPNISTMVGNLYNDDRYKANKDAGFNIFYMGINIGAFVCNFVAAFMRINYGWGYAFYAAGIGMLVGVFIFLSATKHIKHADVIKPLEKGDMPTGKILLYTLVPMIIFGIIGWMIPGNIFGTDSNDAFLIGCVPVVIFFISLMMKANENDKNPIKALLAVYATIVVFWAVFHQNGDALTVWAEDYTDRTMPASIASTADKVGMAQTVHYGDYVEMPEEEFHILDSTKKAELAIYDNQETKESREMSKKLSEEISLMNKSRMYFSNLNKVEYPEKGQDLKLVSTELYQSINPFWVVVLTPVVVGIFGWLRRKNMEPNTAMKIAIGLLITALSAFVMFAAVKATNMEADKASSWWLIASYGVITVGELCLSPMGLSLVSKLSPPRITALMMGGFFLSTAVGNKLSGMLSGMWEGFEDKSYFFLMNFVLVFAAFIVMFILVKWLSKVMREKNIH